MYICGNGPESTLHFLFLCPLFKIPREKLFETIDPILKNLNIVPDNAFLSKFLLYGNENLTPLQNRSILQATLEYIQNTKRLSAE